MEAIEVSVITNLRLNDYATTPLYNIKAVVQSTNISPSTLRAWERRYNMCHPQRSESGYRLYSERDVAIIRWLKTQVDAGMSISQAVSWLDNITEEAKEPKDVVLPVATPNTGLIEPFTTVAAAQRGLIRDFSALQQDLLRALLAYDDAEADQILSEAFALYSVEQLGENFFMPVLVEIGERWRQGDVSVTNEHFASNYLLQRLKGLLRTVPNGTTGPLIWVGCAPTELHEGGAVLLGVYLRRCGYHVHYLGQSLPVDDFAQDVARLQPAMILFSATTVNAVQELVKLTSTLGHVGANAPTNWVWRSDI